MDRSLFDDEHEWFRESVRSFVDRSIVPAAEEARLERSISRTVWREAGAHGFLGLGIPAEYGGSGIADFRFNAVLGEELSRHAGLAYGSAFGIHVDAVAPYLVELTTDQQKERWLPGFCSGELITAIAMTEPNAGSDLRSIQTSAQQHAEGWILNGAKTFITNGYGADLVVVAAQTSTSATNRGITLFAVEATTPGVSRGRKLHKIGQPEADTAELFFDDVQLPADAAIGGIGHGLRHMMERLSQERLSSACANVAHAFGALDRTLEYVKERRAFGRAIGAFQHSRFQLAELSTELDVAQAYVDRCIVEHVRGSLSPVDAAKAKWWTAEVQNRVIDGCVQLHGGYGYMDEYEVARAWADARVTKIWAGSNEIMKEIIGRSMGLGEPVRE